MLDPTRHGVSEDEWREATASCHPLRVREIIEETHDALSIVLEIPESLREAFRYRPGQFLSFKFPYQGRVLVRSYSLASSPHCDDEHKVTVKRIDDGRISNLINDEVESGSTLMVTPPAGFFVLNDADRKLVLFGGGSGITPVISIVKSALATTDRPAKLVYANRDERSIIFRRELEALASRHGDRFEIVHSLDDTHGFLDADTVKRHVNEDLDADFFLCGPGAFMDVVENALRELGVDPDRIHIERFVSPPDPGEREEVESGAADATEAGIPASIQIVLDGKTQDVPYEEGQAILLAARQAGLDPPFSCEEGYCSCCMAKLVEGEVRMATNDCLTPDLLAEGWILTCQARCTSRKVKIEYPD